MSIIEISTHGSLGSHHLYAAAKDGSSVAAEAILDVARDFLETVQDQAGIREWAELAKRGALESGAAKVVIDTTTGVVGEAGTVDEPIALGSPSVIEAVADAIYRQHLALDEVFHAPGHKGEDGVYRFCRRCRPEPAELTMADDVTRDRYRALAEAAVGALREAGLVA